MAASGSPSPSQLDPGAFTATVSAITHAFGDPTRRAIYLFVREHSYADATAASGDSTGVTAAQVAETFGLHPNVARLAGGGAGRPSKHYTAVGEDPAREFPVRSDDLVLSLLGKALALLPSAAAEAMAEDVGQEYGRAMAAGLTGADLAAGQRNLRSAMQAVADALTAHGFAAHTDQRHDQLRIVNQHCPFGNVAIEHPVICAVDRGMVKGMLAALYGDTDVSTQMSRPQGDTFCATAV